MSTKTPRLVMVDWEDAYSQSTWHNDQEIDVDFLDRGRECVNVGYLVRDHKDYIVIASRASHKNGSYGHLQRIPRGMVKKVTPLRIGAK